MPKYKMVSEKECPHCGEMLSYMKEKRVVEQFYDVYPQEFGDNEFENSSFYDNDYNFDEEGDITESECYCPYCEENLPESFFVEEIKEEEPLDPKKILLNAIKN